MEATQQKQPSLKCQELNGLLCIFSSINCIHIDIESGSFLTSFRELINRVEELNERALFDPDKKFKQNGSHLEYDEYEPPQLHELFLVINCGHDQARCCRIQHGLSGSGPNNQFRCDSSQVFVELRRAHHCDCNYAVSLGKMVDTVLTIPDIGDNPLLRFCADSKSATVFNDCM